MKEVVKRDGSIELFSGEKIKRAIESASDRVGVKVSGGEVERVISFVLAKIGDRVGVEDVHRLVEEGLCEVNSRVGQSYREYRDYKREFVEMMDKVYKKVQSLEYVGDRNNANTDSTLASTKRSIGWQELNGEFYKKFFLSPRENRAMRDGYIYIHDRGSRLDSANCQLFDMDAVLDGGFELGNIKYSEPTTLAICFQVMADVIVAAAAQNYGGFTVVQVDKLLNKYAKKSYNKYYLEELEALLSAVKVLSCEPIDDGKKEELGKMAEEKAVKKVQRDFEQGFQSIEYKLNTISSSRGDYPFVTFTFGLGEEEFEQMATSAMLKVRKEGQGVEGFKRPVLFPKLVFLYDEEKHGVGKTLERLFNEAIECSAKAQYPDFLSMSGKGYIASMYKEYGEVISPMGCRAFLSPYWINGGQKKLDDTDRPVFVGRWNAGAISLNLPMIFMKAKEENKDFYEVYDYYLEMIRGIHKKTWEYLAKMKASKNPLGYTQGGFYKGYLKPDEEIRPLLDYVTFSFGYTALNELQRLYNGKSIIEDGEFALEVMKHLNEYIAKIKEEDHILYAIYSTPAETLLPLQVEQFRAKYGIIKDVSDKDYFTNSFHCHVSEKISPIEKQDYEERFWELCNGGKITYTRYPTDQNLEAMKVIVRRGMAKGFYQGINLDKCYCEHCGYEQLSMTKCPKCGSEEITQVNRVCGYLGYTKVKGRSFMNDGKLAEIKDRVSM